jgi:hypothetical protein
MCEAIPPLPQYVFMAWCLKYCIDQKLKSEVLPIRETDILCSVLTFYPHKFSRSINMKWICSDMPFTLPELKY